MLDDCPYTIEAPLGRGGQAHTFRARHAESGALVALKRFRLADADTWKAHELFERECEVLAALDHPAVPRFVASGQSPDGAELWLAMELVEGEALSAALVHGRPMEHAALEDLALQLLGVLDHLHTRAPPVIHRDIKPANLVMRPDGWVALVDFGSVRTALRPEGGSTVVGTFGYFAPEQLHGEATPATDLYALGMTLAALAAGRDATLLPRRGLALDVAAILPEGRLRALIALLTTPDPTDRPASARAARHAIAQARLPTASAVPATPATAAVAGGDVTVLPARRRMRGPVGLVLELLATLYMVVGGVVLDLYEHRLRRTHARRLRRAERRARGNPTKLGLARMQLEARASYELARAAHARQRLVYVGGRAPRIAAPSARG